jgi:hypothetical protein
LESALRRGGYTSYVEKLAKEKNVSPIFSFKSNQDQVGLYVAILKYVGNFDIYVKTLTGKTITLSKLFISFI